MARSDTADTGDALLQSWAVAMEELQSCSIGYPSATMEGRARQPTTHRPPGPRVPILRNWPIEVQLADDAVRQLDGEQYRIVHSVYCNSEKPQARSQWVLLREARLYVCGFVRGCLWGRRHELA